jgi:hypothetical protein
MQVFFQSGSSTSFPSSTLTIVNEALAAADRSGNLDEKRAHYQQAYAVFQKKGQPDGSLPEELRIPFHRFLETYAQKTCYAQQKVDQTGAVIDAEEGFRKSARLMELSFLLQLKEINLVSFNCNWPLFLTIEAIIQNLMDKPVLYTQLVNLQFSPEGMASYISDPARRTALAATLRRMTYSHQNITDLIAEPSFHLKCHALTAALFDTTTAQGQLDRAEYEYNRCGFLVSLEKLNETQAVNKKIEAYDRSLALFKEICTNDLALQRTLQGKISQINNMKGILSKDWPQAEAFFREAFRIRKALLEDNATEQHDEDEYLLANIRTGLIFTLCNPPVTEERLEEAKGHKEALENYIKKRRAAGDTHNYQEAYQNAINRVVRLLNK